MKVQSKHRAAANEAPGGFAIAALCECGFNTQRCRRMAVLSEFLEDESVEPAAFLLQKRARCVD